jgi:hypothetical protein
MIHRIMCQFILNLNIIIGFLDYLVIRIERIKSQVYLMEYFLNLF